MNITTAARTAAKILAGLVIAPIAALALAGGFDIAAPSTEAGTAAAPTERIYEDDPRWDCRTMGNRICGPTAGQEPFNPADPSHIPHCVDTAADSYASRCHVDGVIYTLA